MNLYSKKLENKNDNKAPEKIEIKKNSVVKLDSTKNKYI